MVAENAFLAAVTAFLQGKLALNAVGVAEPVDVLPAVVLSLDEVRRARDGVGARWAPGSGRVRLFGVLRVDVWGAEATEVAQISEGMVEALLAPAALNDIERLVSLDLTQLGSVEAPRPDAPGRRRAALFRFEFEHAVASIEPEEGVLKTVEVQIYEKADDGKVKAIEKPFRIEDKPGDMT